MNEFKIKYDKLKKNLKNIEYVKKLLFYLFDIGISFGLLFSWAMYVLIVVVKSLNAYDSLHNYDPIISLSVLGFLLLSGWFVIGPLPRMITYPIGKKLGVIGSKNKPVMPKGWKSGKK